MIMGQKYRGQNQRDERGTEMLKEVDGTEVEV